MTETALIEANAAGNAGATPFTGGTVSLREQAYEAIKHRIVTCAYKPGEYLNEANISKALGLGRTPVHQALDRLMLEHMVEVIPRKGVIVKPVSLEEVMAIIDVRLVNEPYCAGLAAERADSGDIAQMSAILAQADEMRESRDIERRMLADRKFHSVMAHAAKNDVLADVLRKLHERSLRFWFISLSVSGHLSAVDDEHRKILDAIESRDPEAARQRTREHIESFRSNIISYI